MLGTRWARRTRLLGAIGAIGVAGCGIDATNSKVISRTLRVLSTGAHVIIDYHISLKKTGRDQPEYKATLQAFNQRTAVRLLRLCFDNGGIYTKFGQQLATFNHALPREYTETLAQLQDRAKAVGFDEAMKTVESELKRPWQEVFRHIERSPIASASLGQVHDAIDHHGRRVAVKVQYSHLARQMTIDFVVMKWAFMLTEYFFPSIQIQWIFPEFETALRAELDFENEKHNSRRIASLLEHNKCVYVPDVYDSLSTKKLLVMEYIDAPKISEIEAISALGVDPREVAHALCETFGEMVFCHGFVHCDPHPGNIFVRKNPDPSAKSHVQLVLLDHGLYRDLDEGFRQTYCDLWRAIILRDDKLMQECGRRLNAGEFGMHLPLLFTYRSLKSSSSLGNAMSDAEKEELTQELRKIQFSDVSEFLEKLPRDMLFVFRTNNMIRSLNKDLGGTTRDRFAVMGKFAVEGHSLYHSDDAGYRAGRRIRYWWDHLNLIFYLNVVDLVLSLAQVVNGETVKAHRSG